MLLLLNKPGGLTPENFGIFMMLALFVAASLGGLPEQLASLQRALGATDSAPTSPAFDARTSPC